MHAWIIMPERTVGPEVRFVGSVRNRTFWAQYSCSSRGILFLKRQINRDHSEALCSSSGLVLLRGIYFGHAPRHGVPQRHCAPQRYGMGGWGGARGAGDLYPISPLYPLAPPGPQAVGKVCIPAFCILYPFLHSCSLVCLVFQHPVSSILYPVSILLYAANWLLV